MEVTGKVTKNLFGFGMHYDEKFWDWIDELTDIFHIPAQYHRFFGDDEESLIEEETLCLAWLPSQTEYDDGVINILTGCELL